MKVTRLLTYILFTSFIIVIAWGTVVKYYPIPNAEEVYEEYFLEYGLNATAKEEVLTELKLMINYFSYEKALGNNAIDMILKAQEFAPEQISSCFQKELSQFKSLTTSSDAVPVKVIGQKGKLCKDFSEFLQYQQNLIEEYKLPYHVENSALQILNINEAFASKEEIALPVILDSSINKKNIAELKTFPWRSADIIVGHRKNGKKINAIQGFYNHIGIYNEKCKCIIEAVPPSLHSKGGVRQSSWKYWTENFTQIAILRIKGLRVDQREKIASYALQRLGESYSLSTYKKNEEGGWYCSKLVYMSYLHAGINLDRKYGISLFPDDIVMYPDLETHTCFPVGL